MAKLLENTFRAVNIGLVNELAIMAHGMGINIWKVIDAAATKPFGYTPFYPGPGWGGHCIPVDPFYLTWRARLDGYESGFIEQAGRINSRMPTYVVDRVSELLNERLKPVRGSKVMLIGVAYKRDVSDVRESPAIDIAELLMHRGAVVKYHDPHVETFIAGNSQLASTPLTCESLQEQDCVVILTDHRAVDYSMVVDCSDLVFDTRNAVAALSEGRSNVMVL
jgi:UDP-N-acetyl-D-glucosamine dehydrogenase